VYYNGKKDICYVKRFHVENIQKDVLFISDDPKSELLVATTTYKPKINIEYNKRLKETKNLKNKIESLDDIVEVKGVKAQGNQLTKLKVKDVDLLPNDEDWPEEEIEIIEEIESNKETIADTKDDIVLNINNDNPIELELTIDNKTKDNDSNKKPDNNEDTQMSLF
jgi:topoisomerase-4 subunit A